MKKIGIILGTFLALAALALGFLALGTLLPQGAIDRNMELSAQQLMQEGQYPTVGDLLYSSRLDNYTDSLILAQSKAMGSLPDILRNPAYAVGEELSPVEDFAAYAQGELTEPAWFYVRYWMGFRTVIRGLSLLMTHQQMRRCVAFTFFMLLGAVLLSIAKHCDSRAAFLLLLSVLLTKPYTAALSLQLSCCFLIAFAAMLAMPLLARHRDWIGRGFLAVGMATMFFDFYTVPILTFGLPFLYLCLLGQGGWKRLGQCVLMWSLGYFGMWLLRLALVTAFTDINGLENGFQSTQKWLGTATGSIVDAIRLPMTALIQENLGAKPTAVLAGVGLGIVAYRTVKNRATAISFIRRGELLTAAILPLIWFCVAAEPTRIHYWFQYRSLTVTVWGVALWMMESTKEHSPDTLLSNE